MTWSSKAGEDALRWLAESSKRAELLEEEVQVRKLQLSEILEMRYSALVDADDQKREMTVLGVLVRVPGDELDLFKRCESAHCDMEVMTRNVADA